MFPAVATNLGINTLQCVEPQSAATSNRPFAIEIAIINLDPNYLCEFYYSVDPTSDIDTYINKGYVNAKEDNYKTFIVNQNTLTGDKLNTGKYLTMP